MEMARSGGGAVADAVLLMTDCLTELVASLTRSFSIRYDSL
jgi:hypothetical protein